MEIGRYTLDPLCYYFIALKWKSQQLVITERQALKVSFHFAHHFCNKQKVRSFVSKCWDTKSNILWVRKILIMGDFINTFLLLQPYLIGLFYKLSLGILECFEESR